VSTVKDSNEIQLEKIKEAVDAQSLDHSLWFVDGTAPESYLQQSLRWLHRVIEDLDPEALERIKEQSEEHR